MNSKLSFKAALTAALAFPPILVSGGLAAPPTPNLGMAIMSAAVDQNGNPRGGEGVVRTYTPGTGKYYFAFHRSIEGCTYVGGVSGSPNPSFPGFVTIEAEPFTIDNVTYHGLKVESFLSDLRPISLPVQVIVFCPR